MQDIILSAKGLSIGYNNLILAENINLEIKRSDIVSLIGPNGSGKTTFLKTVLGINKPLEGSINIKNIHNPGPEDIKDIVGYVPQVNSYDSSFPLKGIDFILMGFYPMLKFYQNINRDMKEKAFEYARWFRVNDLLQKPIGVLSEGQKQKISIIRAIISEPELLLLDEPFSSIDVRSSEEISEILLELARKKITILMVNHNIQMIQRYTDMIICIGKNIFIHGKPKEVLSGEVLECIYGKDSLFLHHNDIPHMVLKKH